MLDAVRNQVSNRYYGYAERTANSGYGSISGNTSDRFDEPLATPTEVFSLSWACWRKGNEPLAAALFDNVTSQFGLDANQAGQVPGRLESEIASLGWDRACGALRDPQLRREQMLAQFERYLKNFPNSRNSPQGREIAKNLRPLVQEETEHAERRSHGKPFEQLSQQRLRRSAC